MQLTHLGISHFRSIGETPVMINLSKKITVLVGQNDCGKSNVLRSLDWLEQLKNGSKWIDPVEIDRHKRSQKLPLLHLRGSFSGETSTTISVNFITELAKGFQGEKLCPEIDTDDIEQFNLIMKAIGENIIAPPNFRRIDARDVWKGKALVKIAEMLRQGLPKVHNVPQFRRIESGQHYSIDGKGIVGLLSAWQHPEIGRDEDRGRFDRIERLLQSLLETPSLRLEVPPSNNVILVNDGRNRLPLESHGTGIHQIIILAIAVLSEDNVVFGIEEPEMHLHPLLQRRFVQFLREETGKNKYVITTHSQTIISLEEEVDVIHLKMVEGVTIPNHITTDFHALDALDDLGIRASDILQANSVIWVEGPSDRIYLKRWLELVNSEMGGAKLIEGIDYSIMFYGGRLLSHLSMERDGMDGDLDGFVQLLRINQRSAILMDSDRKKSINDPLNDTKKRVIAECSKNGLHAWVTNGREIENYLTPRSVEAALTIAEVTIDECFNLNEIDSFNEAMERVVGAKAPAWCVYDKHKVAWAHRIVQQIELQDIGVNLKNQVTYLLQFIRRR